MVPPDVFKGGFDVPEESPDLFLPGSLTPETYPTS